MCDNCEKNRREPFEIPSLEEMTKDFNGDAEAAQLSRSELQAGLELWQRMIDYADSQESPDLFPDGGGTRSCLNHLMTSFFLPVITGVVRESAPQAPGLVLSSQASEHLIGVVIEAFAMGYNYHALNGVALSHELAEKYKVVAPEAAPIPATTAPDSEDKVPEWRRKLNEFFNKGESRE